MQTARLRSVADGCGKAGQESRWTYVSHACFERVRACLGSSETQVLGVNNGLEPGNVTDRVGDCDAGVYRGAVQSNAGQEDSILSSPRRERAREIERGRESEREMRRGAAWTGPGRGGVAGRCCKDSTSYSHGAKDEVGTSYVLSHLVQPEPIAARARLLPCVCPIDIPPWSLTGALPWFDCFCMCFAHKETDSWRLRSARGTEGGVPSPFHDSAPLSALCRLQYRHTHIHIASGKRLASSRGCVLVQPGWQT